MHALHAREHDLVHIVLDVLLRADALPLVLCENGLLARLVSRVLHRGELAPPAQGPIPAWQVTHARCGLDEHANNGDKLRGGDSCRGLGEWRNVRVWR